MGGVNTKGSFPTRDKPGWGAIRSEVGSDDHGMWGTREDLVELGGLRFGLIVLGRICFVSSGLRLRSLITEATANGKYEESTYKMLHSDINQWFSSL